ncbi:MAG: hypothetical protein L0387_24920 [Acidobacteria bacterium]|nr:hypothetical protein [Acidobacteriota bacterium]
MKLTLFLMLCVCLLLILYSQAARKKAEQELRNEIHNAEIWTAANHNTVNLAPKINACIESLPPSGGSCTINSDGTVTAKPASAPPQEKPPKP